MLNDGGRAIYDLRARTKQFALRTIALHSALAQLRSDTATVLGKQLLRSGTSVGAQYREACRSRSQAEFVSKMESASQELDETIYWLELLVESNTVKESRLGDLLREANELMAIFIASARTAKSNSRRKKETDR